MRLGAPLCLRFPGTNCLHLEGEPSRSPAAAAPSARRRWRALRSRGFIDHQGSALKHPAVARFNSMLRCGIVGSLCEPVTARVTRKAVVENRNGQYVHRRFRKPLLQFRLCSLERKVANEQLLQSVTHDYSSRAASFAKYVSMKSAPARFMDTRLSRIARSRSSQPFRIAAINMLNSPLTW